MRKLFIILASAILMSACSTNEKDSAIVIDLTTPTDTVCYLSEIADSMMYYPLAIDGKIMDIELLSDYIWIHHRTDSVKTSLLNRKDGSMIHETKISALLHDGGFEFEDDFSTFFRLEDETVLVSPVSTIKGVKRYWHSVSMDAITGEKTDTITYPYNDGIEYSRLNEEYLLRQHRIIGDDIQSCFKMNWHTITLDSIKQDVFSDTVFQTFLSWNQTKVHLLKDKVFFHFPTMKTIYEISANHAPIPLYRYEVGKHNHHYNQIKDVSKYWEAERKGLLSCYAIRTSLISDNYIFGGFNYKGLIHWVLFNRNTNQKVIIPTKSTIDYQSLEGIKNDLDGGIDFWPKRISKKGEIYTWYKVEDLKSKMAQSNHEQMKNPKAAQRLKELLKNLPEGVTEVSASDIEKNVGISRQFSVFELTKELSFRNSAKALRIAAYIGSSAKFAMPMAVSALYTHFYRILKYAALLAKTSRPTNDQKSKVLGVNPYFYSEYDTAVRNYPMTRCMSVISLLREYDYKGKGGEAGEATPAELMVELTARILNI